MTPAEFVSFLYADLPSECSDAQITLWMKPTKESIHVTLPSSNPDRFNGLVQTQIDHHRDVYFGVSLRRPNLTSKQRGREEDCRGLPGLFLDIDIDDGSSAHKSDKLPKSIEQALPILEVLPDPTGMVSSGHGLHVYWLFDRVMPIAFGESSEISDLSRAFQSKAILHAQSLGYHVDDTGTVDRVLRLPGTKNFKGGFVSDVETLFVDGPRYASLNTLLQAAQIDKRAQLVPSAIASTNIDDVDVELLAPRDAGAKAQTDEWIVDALGKLHSDSSRELMETVLAGQSFAPVGARDQTLQRIASIIAYLAPDRSPEELAESILGPSLQTFEADDKGKYTQADRVEWAAEKISRAQEDARRDRVVRERHDAKLAEVLLKQARSAPRRDQRLGPAAQGPYTDAEIASFASQQQTTPSSFPKRWIIQKGQSFYVYINGDYQLPLTFAELDVSLPRDLSPAVANGFISLDTKTAKGEPRKKTTKEILSDYASVARTVVSRLDAGFSYYDESTQTFYEASCPIRPLVPVFNNNVDLWLRHLGGSKADVLLDWVATVTNLDKQSSALYLQGPAGTGKSLISQGLARLWQQGGPTELVRVLGEWSADIARCPLIVADEQIPQSFKGQRTSAELRSLIGNSARTLTRKYLANSDLVGAVRLILSANNADMLVFDETLSQADLEAISGRFLHISGNAAAKNFLTTIDTTGWVDEDIIAKHALWLRDNRVVVPGRRFLVEGSARDVSKQLATRGSIAGRVAEWLVRYLCETPTSQLAAKQSSPQQSDMVRVGNGRYLVNTNALVNFWEQYSKAKITPTTPVIGSALRNLSTATRRIGKRRYYDVDVEAIGLWADANLIGDSQTIVDRVFQQVDDADLDSATEDAE